ncbi:hypothetical protein [Halovivax limisalsi]|uniref:hypothetical protein n=1 Tax=Halovivax limisalsi TaxID=1453760 RepID=UPI001FFC4932|nr:hypothetical protein [Halovivax limisalsi]
MLESVRPRTIVRTLVGVTWLLVVLTGWVVGLSLVFLATGWPRVAFYALLVGGAIAFAIVGDPLRWR